MERTRLDQLLVTTGLAPSRSAARGLILAGLVSIDGRMVDKCGASVPVSAEVQVKSRPRYVSRGGEKLARALEVFPVPVEGVYALDVGSSTGGFVDCLLQHGARSVIALDVGRGQLHPRLREDARVFVREGINARYLTAAQLPYQPELVTMDVSFISAEKILPSVMLCAQENLSILVLVKPQFEAGRAFVGKGGVVRDPLVRREAVLRVATFAARELGLGVRGVCDSGLPGPRGNREYFLWLARCSPTEQSAAEVCLPLDKLEILIDAAVRSEVEVASSE